MVRSNNILFVGNVLFVSASRRFISDKYSLKLTFNPMKNISVEWREVGQEKYQEIFRKLRELITIIENNPRLNHKGLSLNRNFVK